jgi:membrane-associated phospholipid phosphatase
VDFQLFHLVNHLLLGHDLIADEVEDFSLWSVPALAAATVGLWLLGRPGTLSRWRVASASALASAGIALLTNQVIAHLWARERPVAAHPGSAHLYLVHPSHDPSFPSDHAAASFAIAFAVLFVSRRAGIGFLVAAAAISVARVLLGLHYPGDIAAGVLVGLGSAAFVHHVALRPVRGIVLAVGRVTDVVLAPLWRLGERRRARPYPKRPVT